MTTDQEKQDFVARTTFRQKLILTVVGASIIAVGIIAGRYLEAVYYINHINQSSQRRELSRAEREEVINRLQQDLDQKTESR